MSREAHELSEKTFLRNGLAAVFAMKVLSACFYRKSEALAVPGSFRLYDLINDYAGQASALNIIGNVYHALGDYENALRITRKVSD